MSDGPLPNPNPYVDSQSRLLLEQAARLSKGKDLSQLSISDARSLFDKLQTPVPAQPDITISKTGLQTSHGRVDTFIFKSDPDCIQPYIFYVHGGAYILGNVSDFYPLIFDLVRRTGCALVFPQYTLAPESNFQYSKSSALRSYSTLLKAALAASLGSQVTESSLWEIALEVSQLEHGATFSSTGTSADHESQVNLLAPCPYSTTKEN